MVNLKTKGAGDGYPRRAIEKMVLRFLGLRTFHTACADTGPFRPRPGTGRFDPNPSCLRDGSLVPFWASSQAPGSVWLMPFPNKREVGDNFTR